MNRVAETPWILLLLIVGLLILVSVIIPWVWHGLRGGAAREPALRGGARVLLGIVGFAGLAFLFLSFSYVGVQRIRDSYQLIVPDPVEVWNDQGRMLAARNPRTEPAWVRQARAGRKSGGVSTRTCHVQYSLPQPGASGWLAGFSTSLADSREAALDLARDSAAEQLRGLLLLNYVESNPDGEILFPEARSEATRYVTRERVRQQEINSYVEEAEFAGGPTYRSVVLVKADPRTLGLMARELADRLHAARLAAAAAPEPNAPPPGAFSRVAQALGLAVIAFLIATFFNASRAGRFAWPLRITSFTLLSAIYFALAYLRGWI